MICGGLRTKVIKKEKKSKYPLLSIITVVYNGEAVLEKTIQSVINQSYDNVEYIIVDGNSSDGTLDIIKKFENKIDYWQSEPDKGIYDAMNKGIDLAEGTWFCFMNAGDLFADENVLKSVFEKKFSDEVKIIYGNPVDGTEKTIKQHKLSKVNLFLERNICHQAIFSHRDTYDDNKFDTSYKIIADRKWLYKAVCKYKYMYIDLPFCIYDQTGVSSNYEKFVKESGLLQKELFGIWGVLERKIKGVLGK